MNEIKDSVDNIIDQWQREMPELEATNMLLPGRVWKCAALLEVYTERVFAEYGLTRWQFDVLATLRRSGAPYRLSPTELFSAMMVSSGTMTARLQKLELQGLIGRKPNPQDARSLLVELTDKGKGLIEKAVFRHVENEKMLMEQLDRQTREQLEGGLAQLLALLEKHLK